VAGALAYLGTSAGADASLAPALSASSRAVPRGFASGRPPDIARGDGGRAIKPGSTRIPPWLMTGLNRVDSGADDQQG